MHTKQEPSIRETSNRPRLVFWIGIAIAITISRLSVALSIPELEMFDGVEPDAWFAPWVSDTILGLLVPLMVYLALRKTGAKVWGALIAYNAIGAFDYSHGLLTQWTDPQVASSAAMVYGPIGFFLVVQLIVTASLFRSEVIRHFLRSAPARPDSVTLRQGSRAETAATSQRVG